MIPNEGDLARVEPYVQLVDVTATAALVARGGFVLEPQDGTWRARRTGETFGVRSEPVGRRAAVEVLDGEGRTVARTATDDANHARVEGLEVGVRRAEGHKCARCWRIVREVSAESGTEGLCDRCMAAIAGTG